MFHLLRYVGHDQLTKLPGSNGFAVPRMATFACMAILAMTSLAGCAAKPVVIEKPVVVTRTVYVPIDAALTAHGDVPMPRTDTGREVLRVARTRRTALEQCHAQLDEIGSVQGTEKKGGPSAESPC